MTCWRSSLPSPVAARKLSDLILALCAEAGDPDAHAVFVTYERPNGEVAALIACPSGLRHLADETILLATECAHLPAAGLH